MTPIIAYLDQQRLKRFQPSGRPWGWNTLADRAHLNQQTFYQLRSGLIEFNFRHWLCLHNNAQITIPALLLPSALRQQALEYLRGGRKLSHPQAEPVPCGVLLDWSPEIRCYHWRGNNAFQGSGCYHETCPRRPIHQELNTENHHE